MWLCAGRAACPGAASLAGLSREPSAPGAPSPRVHRSSISSGMYNKRCPPLGELSPEKTTWTVIEAEVQHPSRKGEAQHAPGSRGAPGAPQPPQRQPPSTGLRAATVPGPCWRKNASCSRSWRLPSGVRFGAGDVGGAVGSTWEKLPGHEGRALGEPADECSTPGNSC